MWCQSSSTNRLEGRYIWKALISHVRHIQALEHELFLNHEKVIKLDFMEPSQYTYCRIHVVSTINRSIVHYRYDIEL